MLLKYLFSLFFEILLKFIIGLLAIVLVMIIYHMIFGIEKPPESIIYAGCKPCDCKECKRL